jgi:hypothetical protein
MQKDTLFTGESFLAEYEVAHIATIEHDKYYPLPSLKFVFLSDEKCQKKEKCDTCADKNICEITSF